MKITMIPIPPNHCDSERHRNRLEGKAAKSASTVAPVAVNPLIDSKRALRGVRLPDIA